MKGHLCWYVHLICSPSEHLTLQCLKFKLAGAGWKGQMASHMSDGWISLMVMLQSLACSLSRPWKLQVTNDNGRLSCWMVAPCQYGNSTDDDGDFYKVSHSVHTRWVFLFDKGMIVYGFTDLVNLVHHYLRMFQSVFE